MLRSRDFNSKVFRSRDREKWSRVEISREKWSEVEISREKCSEVEVSREKSSGVEISRGKWEECRQQKSCFPFAETLAKIATWVHSVREDMQATDSSRGPVARD